MSYLVSSCHCSYYLMAILLLSVLSTYSLELISGQNLSILVPIWLGDSESQIAMVAFHV